MKIAIDTNILARIIVNDDTKQNQLAMQVIDEAELVIIGSYVLCELVWLMGSRYQVSRADIAKALRHILLMEKVQLDRPAVEAGLALYEAGAGFADGVIAYEGQRKGADAFISFDKKAVALLNKNGKKAKLLA